jgi:transcription elongation factor Elf1
MNKKVTEPKEKEEGIRHTRAQFDIVITCPYCEDCTEIEESYVKIAHNIVACSNCGEEFTVGNFREYLKNYLIL